MSLRFEASPLELRTRHTFTIARGGSDTWRTVMVRLEERGIEGLGEAQPSRYYGEDVENSLAALSAWARGRATLERPIQELLEGFEGPRAARAALDIALHDRAARRQGLTVTELLEREHGLERRPVPLTSFTIGLDTPERIVAKTREAAEFPILKVKLAPGGGLEALEAVRSASGAELRVDANASWTVEETLRKAPRLVDLGVTLLEQPLPPGDLAGYRQLHGELPIPVYADESCRVLADVAAMEGAVDGINVKLAKCGGLREAALMVREARRRGLAVMIGCFVESSLAITAAASLAPFADALDLDGAALLADDPFDGVRIPGGRIEMPPTSGGGLGVRRR